MMLGQSRHAPFAGLATCSLLVSQIVNVAAFTNKFLYPVIFHDIIHNGDVMPVQYVSNYTEPTLTMFCREPYEAAIITKYQVQAPSGNATVDVKIQLTNIEGCWYNLKSDGEEGINTNAWKLFNNGTEPTSTSSSTVASTTTSSATSTATSATTPTMTPISPTSTPANTDTSASSQVQGMSADAKAGLGAGIAVAGILFIGAAIFFCVTRRKVNTLIRKDPQYQYIKHELPSSQGFGSAAQSVISYPPPQSSSGTSTVPVYTGYYPQQQEKMLQELQGAETPPYFAPQQYPYTTTVQLGGRQEMYTHEPTAQEIYSGEQRPQELGSPMVHHSHVKR